MLSMPESWRLRTGDCLDVLATREPDSVDACVTDPPYGISFMGREWDTFTPATVEKMRTPKAFGVDEVNPNLRGRTGWAGSAAIAYDRSAAASLKFHAWTQQWAEAVLRVLKPGAHAVVCASPRMGHRVTCGLEDAGFEIRDSLLWLYGSGFPKSLNLPGGCGTALKPAYEPVILARKPLGGRTVAQCVAVFGTGALNIDGCRLEGAKPNMVPIKTGKKVKLILRTNSATNRGMTDVGRWPPNVALDEEAAAMLDAEVCDRKAGGFKDNRGQPHGYMEHRMSTRRDVSRSRGDTGGPSRFFYCPKASRDERERGCEDLPRKTAGDATDRQDGSAGLNSPRAGASRTHGARNHHPTVKPVGPHALARAPRHAARWPRPGPLCWLGHDRAGLHQGTVPLSRDRARSGVRRHCERASACRACALQDRRAAVRGHG